jgi:hypothetical protein
MKKTWLLAFCLTVLFTSLCSGANDNIAIISNDSFQFEAKQIDKGIHVRFVDKAINYVWSDTIFYNAVREYNKKTRNYDHLLSPTVNLADNRIIIEGVLAGLRVYHVFELPKDKPFMEETLKVTNQSDSTIYLKDFQVGFRIKVADSGGNILSVLKDDRIIAVPFKHRADDLKNVDNDFSIQDIITKQGWEYVQNTFWPLSRKQSAYRFSEGWAWMHGNQAFCIFKFNQQNLCFSAILPQKTTQGTFIRFGGTFMVSDMPSALSEIHPGATVDLDRKSVV